MSQSNLEFYAGLVVDIVEQIVSIAAFNPSREDCWKSCKERCPDGFIYVEQLYPDTSKFTGGLEKFLSDCGVTSDEIYRLKSIIIKQVADILLQHQIKKKSNNVAIQKEGN